MQLLIDLPLRCSNLRSRLLLRVDIWLVAFPVDVWLRTFVRVAVTRWLIYRPAGPHSGCGLCILRTGCRIAVDSRYGWLQFTRLILYLLPTVTGCWLRCLICGWLHYVTDSPRRLPRLTLILQLIRAVVYGWWTTR